MENVTLKWLGGQILAPTDDIACLDMNPKQMMLYALGKCSGMTALALFESMHLQVTGLEMEISGKLTDASTKPQSLFKAITQVFRVECPPETDRNRIIRALELTHDKYCGMTIMMEMIAPVSFDIWINDKQLRRVHY